MKTALITFKRSETFKDAEYLKEISKVFNDGGIDFDSVEIITPIDDLGFKRKFSEMKNTVDNLIVTVSTETCFNIKEIIADEMNTALSENDNALKFLQAVSKSNQKEYPSDYAVMPMDAILVPNVRGGFQGFMMEEEEFTLVVLPQNAEELKSMTDGYVVPYMETKYGVKKQRFFFKYFGETVPLYDALKQAEVKFGKVFSFDIKTVNEDSSVSLSFDCEGKVVSDVKRFIIENLGNNVYAEFDTTLSERVFDVLKLRDKKISVAESFTGGRVAASIISNSGASAYLKEGIVAYSNDSKIKRLGVKKEDIYNHGAVSSKVAYQMALGLLMTGDCDVAVATTGIAGPYSDNSSKPVGLNYIAIGTRQGIHVYKYELKGNREEITETAKNKALFLIIKTLKNI